MSNVVYLTINGPSRAADVHAGFRGHFSLSTAGEVELRLLGASWYAVWLDGEFLTDGPARFVPICPEHSTVHRRLPAGEHTIAVHVHGYGTATRILADVAMFLYCPVFADGEPVDVGWKCRELHGFTGTRRRISPLYGWVHWEDTRVDQDWTASSFDDDEWEEPVAADPGIGSVRPLPTAEVRHDIRPIRHIAEGRLHERMGYYELDDPSARFLLRDLGAGGSNGVWRRYDLGRVRLGIASIVCDLPAGAVVEIAGADTLMGGRVAPYFPGSTGPSCTIDHFVARGGVQEFRPLTPKGARYIEVHVLADPNDMRFVDERFCERGYFGEPDGTFECDDATLNRIWAVAIETLRACAEDALVDTPSRERGQWVGDVVTVCLRIAAAAYGDLRLFRRTLCQAAACASPNGLVAGLAPGQTVAMPSYAAQWISGCLTYAKVTGDHSVLKELLEPAVRTVECLRAALTPGGFAAEHLGPVFIDWGYEPRPAGADMALTLHVLSAVRDLVTWADIVGDAGVSESMIPLAEEIRRIVDRWLYETLRGELAWSDAGYHCTVLALATKTMPRRYEDMAVRAVKRHILRCFPNDASAPRLAHPFVRDERLITPYFSHYAFAELIERGETSFVQQQWARSWGWMLDQGATTLWEVFDDRWSLCHAWSGAPAWQLTRYCLGLEASAGTPVPVVDVRVFPGHLDRASGDVPLPGGGLVHGEWERRAGDIHYSLRAERPVQLRLREPKAGQVIDIGVTTSWSGVLNASS